MTISYATPADHAEAVIQRFSEDARQKYMKGDKEHGGRLYRKPVLGYLYDEVLDLPIYLLTLMEQMKMVEQLLVDAYWANGESPAMVNRKISEAINILRYGNEDGIEEVELGKQA